MKYNIEPNPNTGGLCCFFKHNGKEYYADLCPIGILYNECMIFSASGGEVLDLRELYCRRNIEVTEEALEKCIKKFCDSICQ